jgi:hypothetical protein
LCSVVDVDRSCVGLWGWSNTFHVRVNVQRQSIICVWQRMIWTTTVVGSDHPLPPQPKEASDSDYSNDFKFVARVFVDSCAH